jgi:hypothetical protein
VCGEVGKGCGRVYMVQICVHLYENGKMTPVETIPGMGGGKIKEEVNSSMMYLIYCMNFCKCHTEHNNKNGRKKGKEGRKEERKEGTLI